MAISRHMLLASSWKQKHSSKYIRRAVLQTYKGINRIIELCPPRRWDETMEGLDFTYSSCKDWARLHMLLITDLIKHCQLKVMANTVASHILYNLNIKNWQAH